MKKQNHRLTVLFVLLICQNAFSEGGCTEDQISQYFQTKNNNNDYITNNCDETVNSDKIANNGNTQVTKQDNDEECKHKVFLAGSDDKLYKIMSEIYHTSKNKDNDLVIYFYIYRKRRFTYITSLNTNYEILNYVLTKYSHYFYINHNTNEPSNVRWYVNNLVMVPRRRNRDVFSGQDVTNFVDVDDETNDIELNNIHDHKSTGGNVNANQNTCYQFTIPGDRNYKGRDINIDILQRYEDLKQILKRGNACVSQDTNNEIKFAYVTDSDTAFKNYGVNNGQTNDFACPDRIPCLQNGDLNSANEEIENIENPSDLNYMHKVYRDISNQAPYAKPKYYQFIMPDGRSYKAKDITIDLLNRQLQKENKCPPKQNIELCQQNDDNTILCRSVRKPHDSIYTLNPYRINIPYNYRCYNPTNINSHSINYAGSNINISCRNLDTAYDNTASTAENNCDNDINIASANTNYVSTDIPCCCTNNAQITDSILNLPQTVGNGNIVIPLTENDNNEFNYPGINYAGSNIYANLKENLFKPKEKQVLLNIQQSPKSYLPYQLKIQESPLKHCKINANDVLINTGNQNQNNALGIIPVITNSQIPDPCVVEDNKQNIAKIPCYSASEILKMESDNDEENNNNEATNEKPFYYQGDRVNYRPPYLDHKTFCTPHNRPKDIDTSFNNKYPYSAYYPTKINPFIPNQSNVPTRDNILIIAPEQQPFVGPIRDIPVVFKSEPKQYIYPASFSQNPYDYSTPTSPDITIDKSKYVQEKPLFINMYNPSQSPQTEFVNIPQRYLIRDNLNYPNQKYDNPSNIQPITINNNLIQEKYPTSYEPYVSNYEVKQPNYLNLKPYQLQTSLNNLASESQTTYPQKKLPSKISQHLFSYPPIKYISTDNICPEIPYQTPNYKLKSYNQISNPAIRLQPAKSVFTKAISSTIPTNNMYKPQNPYITEESQNTGSKENNQIELDTRPCAYKNKAKEYTEILLEPETKDTKELIDIPSNPENVFNINNEPLHNNPIITSNIHYTGIYSPYQPSINNNGKLQYNPRNIGSPIIQVSPQKMYYLPKSYITPQNKFVTQNFVSTPDNSLETSSNISPSENFPLHKIWYASKQPIEYPYEFPNEPIQNSQDNYQIPIQNFPHKNPYKIPCTPDQNLPVQNDYETPCTSTQKLPFDNTYKTPYRYTQTLTIENNNQVPCSSIQELPVNTYQIPCGSNRKPSRNIYQYKTPEENLSPQLTNQPWLNSLLEKIHNKPNYSNQNLPLTHIPYIIKPGVTNLYPYSVQTSPLKTQLNQPSSLEIYVSTPDDMNKVYPNNIINLNTDIDRNKAAPQYIYMPDGSIHPEHDSRELEKPIYDNSNVYGSPESKNNAYILPSNVQGEYKPKPVTFIIEKPTENVANPYYINAYLPQTARSIPLRNKPKLNIEMNPNSGITSYQPDIVVQPSQIPYSKSFGQIPSLNMALQPNSESQSYIPEIIEKSLTSSSYPVQKIPLSNIEPLGRPTTTTYQPIILLYPSQPYLAKPNNPIIVVEPTSESKYQPVVQPQTSGIRHYENEPVSSPEKPNIVSDLYKTKEFDQPIQTTYSRPSADVPASNTYVNPTSESISYQPKAYTQPWQTPYTKTTENIPLNVNFKPNLHSPVYDPKFYQSQTVWPKLIQKIPLTNIEISPNSKSTMYQPTIYVQPAQSYLTKPNRNIPAFDIEVSPNTEKEMYKPNVLIEPSQNVWTKPYRNIPILNVEVSPNSETEMHKPNIITQPSQNYWTNSHRNLPLPNIEEGPNSDSTQSKVFIKQFPNPWLKPFNNIPILNLDVKPNAESTKPYIFVQPSQNHRANQYENEPVLNTEIDSYPEGSLYLPTVQPSISPWPKQIKNIPTYNKEVKPNAGSALYRPEFVLQPSQSPWSRQLSKIPTFVTKTVNYEPYQQELLLKPSQIKEPISNKPIFNVEIQPNAESTLYKPETIMLPSQLHWPKSIGQIPLIHVSPSLQSKPYQPVQVPLSKHNENNYLPVSNIEAMPNPKIVLYQPLIEPQETSWSKPGEYVSTSNIEIRPSSASAVYPHKVFIQPSQLPHTNPFEKSPTSDVEPNPNSQSVLYQPDILYVQSPWHKSFGKIPIMNMKINPNTETTFKPQPQDLWSKPITKIPSSNVEANPNTEGTIYRPEMVVKPSQMPTIAFDNEISPTINVNQNPQATMYTPTVQLSQTPRLQSFLNIPILDAETKQNQQSTQYQPNQLILTTQTPSSNPSDIRFISKVLPSTGSSFKPQIFLQPSQGPSYKPYNNQPIINVDASPTSESSVYNPKLSPSSQIPSKPVENIPSSDPKPNSEYTWSQPISQSLQTPWNKPSNIPVLNIEVNPNQDSTMYRPAVLLQPTHKSYSIPVENVPIIEVNPNQETTLNQPKQFIMPSGTPWWQPFERIPVSDVEMNPSTQSTLYKPEIIVQQPKKPIENIIFPNINTRPDLETNPYQPVFVSPSQTPYSQSFHKPTLDIEMGPSKSTSYQPEMFIQPSLNTPQNSLLSPLITVSPVPTINTPSSTFYTPDPKFTSTEGKLSKLPYIWSSPYQQKIPQRELNIILPNGKKPEYKDRPIYFNLKPYTNEVKDHLNPTFYNMNIKKYSPEYKIISRPPQPENNINTPLINNFVIKADIDTKPTKDSTYFKPELTYSQLPKIGLVNTQPIIISTPNSENKHNIPLVDVFSKPATYKPYEEKQLSPENISTPKLPSNDYNMPWNVESKPSSSDYRPYLNQIYPNKEIASKPYINWINPYFSETNAIPSPTNNLQNRPLTNNKPFTNKQNPDLSIPKIQLNQYDIPSLQSQPTPSYSQPYIINQITPNQEHSPSKSYNDLINSYIPKLSITPVPNKVYSRNIPLTYDVKTIPATYEPYSGALSSPESISKPKTPRQESPYPWLQIPSYSNVIGQNQQFEPASKPCLNLINPEIGQSPEYELNPSISIKELFKDRIDALVPKILPTKYYDDNFNDPDLNKRDLKSIDLGDVAVAKYEPKDKILLKTDNPNIDLIAWRSKVKMLNAKLVFNIKDVSAVNFMPIIKQPVDIGREEIQNVAKDIIRRFYGDPIVVKGTFSSYMPYGVIYNPGSRRSPYYVLWPNYCNCGCMQSGCECQYSH